MVFHLLVTLPMAVNWSLFFLHRAPQVRAGRVLHLESFDNFAQRVLTHGQCIDRTCSRLDGKRGFFMRRNEDAESGVTELLGHAISVTSARAWRLRDALLYASD